MNKITGRLTEEFADKEYAHSYMESHTISRIAAQIHAMRKDRGWSQKDLSERSGIAQERISKIESADFNSLTLTTLRKFSRAFDVDLQIALIPFSKGISDVATMTKSNLVIADRESDLRPPMGKANPAETTVVFLKDNAKKRWDVNNTSQNTIHSFGLQTPVIIITNQAEAEAA